MLIQSAKYFYLLLLLPLICNSCIEPAIDSPYPALSFSKITSLPGNGRASAVSFVIEGKGYVALGRNANGVALNDCWQYDPGSDTWTQKASLPDSSRVKAVAAVVNGKAYVGLGCYFGWYNNMDNSFVMLTDFWMYDPKTDNWTKKASLPSLATDACISYVIGNDIYIGGGYNERGFPNEVWKYNTITDKWVQMNRLPSYYRGVSVACGDSLHVFFGTGFRNNNSKSPNDWWEYNANSDTWIQKESMPDKGRGSAVAFTINNRYFVSTGRHYGGTLTGGFLYSDILEYDVIRNCWYHRGDIPNGGRENAISFTINGVGYIGLGENNSRVLNDLWKFNP